MSSTQNLRMHLWMFAMTQHFFRMGVKKSGILSHLDQQTELPQTGSPVSFCSWACNLEGLFPPKDCSSKSTHTGSDQRALHIRYSRCREENVRVRKWQSWTFRAGVGAFVFSSLQWISLLWVGPVVSKSTVEHPLPEVPPDAVAAWAAGQTELRQWWVSNEQWRTGTWYSALTELGALPSLNSFTAVLKWLRLLSVHFCAIWSFHLNYKRVWG